MPTGNKLVERRDKAEKKRWWPIGGTTPPVRPPESKISDSIPSSDTGVFAKRKKLGDLLQNEKFKKNLLTSSTFIYGKVGFYNVVLEQVFGANWDKTSRLKVIRSATELEKTKKEKTTSRKNPLLLLPAVQDANKLNEFISSAIDSKQVIWLVGYPSIIQKHLLAAFRCFFLCTGSLTEIEILQDVVEISQSDVKYLSSGQLDRAVLTTIHSLSEETTELSRPSVTYFYF